MRAFSKTAQERNRLREKCLRCDLCKTKIIIINEQTFEIVCTLVHGFATVFGLDIVVGTFKLIEKDHLIPD